MVLAILHKTGSEKEDNSISDDKDLQKFAIQCANNLRNGGFKITSDEE